MFWSKASGFRAENSAPERTLIRRIRLQRDPLSLKPDAEVFQHAARQARLPQRRRDAFASKLDARRSARAQRSPPPGRLARHQFRSQTYRVGTYVGFNPVRQRLGGSGAHFLRRQTNGR